MQNLFKKTIHEQGKERRDNIPTNILEKIAGDDPEKILQEQLYKNK